MISVISGKALILDAANGDKLTEVALPAEAILYSKDKVYFFMPRMIGYKNASGNITSGSFPVGNFDNALCVTDITSWNHANEFIFVDDRSIYIYEKINDNTDIIRYDSTEENTESNELLVTGNGLVEINADESGTTNIRKYMYNSRTCIWSADIMERYDQIIGKDASEKFLYLLLKSDYSEIHAAQIDLENGDVIVFKVPDSHYQTEPYEKTSVVKMIGAQEDTLLYYSEWYENGEQSYVVCRYNAQNNVLEEHVLPFRLDQFCPGTVFSDNQLVCFSDQHELYVFNTDTWEYTLLEDEYLIDKTYYSFHVLLPKEGMYAIYPDEGNQLDIFEGNNGKTYSVRGKSKIITASNDKELLYILYADGILNIHDLSDGKLVETINLNISLDTYSNSEVKKISENELVISCSDGVYVIDLEYKTIRTHVAAGIGYDEKNDGFYLGICDEILGKMNGAWVRRYSAAEVLERAEQIISNPE